MSENSHFGAVDRREPHHAKIGELGTIATTNPDVKRVFGYVCESTISKQSWVGWDGISSACVSWSHHLLLSSATFENKNF